MTYEQWREYPEVRRYFAGYSPQITGLMEMTARKAWDTASLKWISVEERLPKVLDEVWVWVEFHDSDQEYGDTSWLQEDGTWAMGSAKNFTVTHWMPLPEAPTKEER